MDKGKNPGPEPRRSRRRPRRALPCNVSPVRRDRSGPWPRDSTPLQARAAARSRAHALFFHLPDLRRRGASSPPRRRLRARAAPAVRLVPAFTWMRAYPLHGGRSLRNAMRHHAPACCSLRLGRRRTVTALRLRCVAAALSLFGRALSHAGNKMSAFNPALSDSCMYT